MKIDFDPTSMSDYRRFLQVKRIPAYHFEGRTAVVPDEYAHLVGVKATKSRAVRYEPSPFLFDYQAEIAGIAIRKRRFACFADCVMAGMARSGSVYPLELPAELLEKAFQNTVEMLKAQVEVA